MMLRRSAPNSERSTLTIPCDTRKLPNQTITQRKLEIREAVEALSKALAAGRVKPVIGPQGALAFQGWDAARAESRMTDACAQRQLMASGSALALQAIQRAEMLAGRKVDKQMVAQGAHSHDGGASWHSHKG